MTSNEGFLTDERGKKVDEPFHRELLENSAAIATLREMAVARAIRQGMDTAAAQRVYG